MTERKGANKADFLSYTNNLIALLATYYTGSTVSNMRFFLSAMGLPKTLNWTNHHYNNCDPINEKILDLTDNLIHAALVSEIKQTMVDKYNLTEFQAKTFLESIQGRQWNKSKKVQGLTIGIDVSFDMGWQKRSTGRNYDSRSGHAFLFGLHTKKVIASIVYSKECRK